MKHPSVSVLLIENAEIFELALARFMKELSLSVAIPSRISGKELKSDVVLLDIATLSEGLEGVERLVSNYSRFAPVLLLVREDHIEETVVGLRAGASGFLKQTASPEQLRTAIEIIAAGGIFCDKKLFQKVTRFLPLLSSLSPAQLTKREEDVLRHINSGLSNKEIAQRLSVSEQSVKVYVSNLMRKTGARNRTSLALLAVARGLT